MSIVIKIIKSKAQWLPPHIKYIAQLFISIRALFTFPFFKETPNGTQKFFINIYKGGKDEFIFDGSNEKSYYNQIIKNVPLEYFKHQTIIDLGCGNGSFYFWLENQDISIKQYYGIDFAFESKVLSNKASIKNISINNYFETVLVDNAVYLLSNSLCYISDKDFQYILSQLKSGDKIFIIDPFPNLFWDSHFNGIKPIYRTNKEVSKLLENNGFIVSSCSIDYVTNLKYFYLNPISYCLFAIKTQNMNNMHEQQTIKNKFIGKVKDGSD
jgi:SAM-dependent methyltransferase